MPITKIPATLTEAQGGPREIEVAFDFGADVEEAVILFGDEAVLNGFIAQGKVNLQATLRRMMKPDADGNSKSDAEIHTAILTWKPGVKTVTRKSPVEKIKALLGGLSDEQKAQLRAELIGGAAEATSEDNPNSQAGPVDEAPEAGAPGD